MKFLTNRDINKVLQSVEIRQMGMNYLKKLQVKISNKKLIEQFKNKGMTLI